MGASDFRSMNVGEAIRLELPITLAIDGAGHDDPCVTCIAHSPDILLRVGRVTYQSKLHIRTNFLKRLSYEEGIVLRFHPADVKEVTTRFKSQLREDLSRPDRAHICS